MAATQNKASKEFKPALSKGLEFIMEAHHAADFTKAGKFL